MPKQFKVISNTGESEPRIYTKLTSEEEFKHFRTVAGAVLQDAQNTWAEIWNEFKGTVVDGTVISPEAEKGLFTPKCGWPEFLEKIWLLKHYLDYVKGFCEEK